MKKFLETPLGKGVLEALRWGVLAFATTLVTFLLNNLANFNIDVKWIPIITMILRFIDAELHKTGIAIRGIVRF